MLIRIMQGVRQFKKEPFKKMQTIFESLSAGQHPDVFFISCSDSRVVPTLITDTQVGDLFVSRNIGNIIPPYPLESSEAAGIEYAVNMLGIKDIIICGHSDCGAMKGLLTEGLEKKAPFVASWLEHSQPVLRVLKQKTKPTDDFAATLVSATKENVLLQLEHLKTFPFVAEKLAHKELNLHAWFYDIMSGEVFIYESQCGDFILLEESFQLAIEERRKQIITAVAMEHLNKLISPQSAENYEFVKQLLSQLATDLTAIWPEIEKEVTVKLREELGSCYDNSDDSDDPKFKAIIEESHQIKLDNLRDLQRTLQQSPGYRQFCAQYICRNSLSQPISDASKQEMGQQYSKSIGQ